MIKKTSAAAQAKGGPSHAPAKSAGKAKQAPAGDEGGSDDGDESSVFDSVKPQGKVDDGKYDAVIRELVLQPFDPAKGRSVRLKVTIADEGDFQGAEAVQFYKIIEADKSAGKGAAYLKADLAKLGYEDVRFADMEKVFDEIVENKTGILCTVKNNPPYTNVYVNALAEDSEVIAAFLATNPF